VAPDGAFEGGVIAPGSTCRWRRCTRGGQAAAGGDPEAAAESIGKDTVGAMQSGVFWGYIALIEGLIARIKAEWDKPMTVIGTGGVASLFHGRPRPSTTSTRT
jgi:type III pantothenate kinase